MTNKSNIHLEFKIKNFIYLDRDFSKQDYNLRKNVYNENLATKRFYPHYGADNLRRHSRLSKEKRQKLKNRSR